jgi:serine/threonine-protein kinase
VPFATDTSLGTLMARIESPIEVGADLGPLRRVLEAAGTVAPADRLDAAGLVAGLEELVDGMPPPARLPLVGPLGGARPERDTDPTAVPGGHTTVPFDIDRVAPADPHPALPLADAASADRAPRGPARRRRRPTVVAVAVLVLLIAAAVAGGVVLRPRPTHPVPALRGDSEAAARQALRSVHVGLRVGARVYDPSAPAGTVIDQRPASGRIHEGSSVTVTLSKGPQPVPVPGVTGRTQADATTVLTDAGLKVGAVTTAASLSVPAGTVISTNPDHGTLLPGQTVDLVVSSGKPTVPVPGMSGTATGSYSAAQAALAAVGLSASESQAFSDTVPAGEVIGTQPGPGSPAPLGSTVVVEVSKGPDLVVIPPVAGSNVAAASAALSGAGFTVSGVSGNPTAPVTGTSPAAGTRVRRGASVQIVTH